MSSKKPIAILMAAAMTMAALSAVSLYADDVTQNNGKPGNNGGEVMYAEDNGEGAAQTTTTAAATTTTTAAAKQPDVITPEQTSGTTTKEEEITPPPTDVLTTSDWVQAPTNSTVIKGYTKLTDVPTNIMSSSSSKETFEKNTGWVDIDTRKIVNNVLQIEVSAAKGEMNTVSGYGKVYAMLFRFASENGKLISSNPQDFTIDKDTGSAWKEANAKDDDYEYIVVWLDANKPKTAITFTQRIATTDRGITQTININVTDDSDPDTTTTSVTTAPENLVSEVSTDWPLKATVTDRRGTLDLDGYKLIIEPCNEVYLNSSRRMPELVAAIKDDKAFAYDITLERNGTSRDFTSLFKVKMALPEKIKSAKDVYLYKASSGGYSSMDIAEINGGEYSFSCYDMGIRIIVSSARLDGYSSETTTGTGTNSPGTASPSITGDSSSALSGAEVRVYSDVMLPNQTRLQITALDALDTSNKMVQVAVSQGKALPYDISLTSNGTAISQTNIKAISVRFNAPSQFNGVSPLYVYRLESDNTLTNMNAGISGGVISFVTAHLSTYIISSVALDGSTVITDNSGNVVTNPPVTTKKPSGGNSGGSDVTRPGDKNDNVNTGFLLALVPVGLAAAGIVFTIKKKR